MVFMLAAYMISAVAMEPSPQPFAIGLKQMLLKASPKWLKEFWTTSKIILSVIFISQKMSRVRTQKSGPIQSHKYPPRR